MTAALEASRSAVTGRFDAGLFGSCLDALLLADAAAALPQRPSGGGGGSSGGGGGESD